jgi:hypothetical protein
MFENLVTRFASAGLDLRLASAPFAAASAEIFQLDIRRARAHDAGTEHFLCWPGADGGSAVVQGLDRSERQLVLMVREGHREFEEAIPAWMSKGTHHAPGSEGWRKHVSRLAGVRPELIIVHRGGAAIRRETRGSSRHMLVGRDERQLFMCELPRPVTSVKAAHEALRVPQAKRSKSALDRPIRQGEWFFVVPSAWELDELEKSLRGNRTVVRKKTSINSIIPRMGKPHVADEIAVCGLVVSPAGQRQFRVYVRGAVRHADHKTIHIAQWRRVFRNLEVDQGRSPLGGTWVD